MTQVQKQLIDELRYQGLGYLRIANKLCMSVSAVKCYCQRQSQKDTVEQWKSQEEYERSHCVGCGVLLVQTPGHKTRKFCSDSCRQSWWNAHPERVHKKAFYRYVCLGCGKNFSAYGDAHRKYCCRRCYINHRYGKVADDE